MKKVLGNIFTVLGGIGFLFLGFMGVMFLLAAGGIGIAGTVSEQAYSDGSYTETIGTVLDVSYDSDGGYTTYEYYDSSNVRHEDMITAYSSAIGPGDEVTVYYDYSYNSSVKELGSDLLLTMSPVFGIFGGVMLVPAGISLIGVIVGIILLISAHKDKKKLMG